MNAPARLGLYGLVLAVVFAAAGFTANAIVSEETVQNWVEEDDHHGQNGDSDDEGHADGSTSHGFGLSHGGYQLAEVTAPDDTGAEGELSFAVTDPDADPVTDFELEHEKEMHLIAVRVDGQHFRHAHPELDDQGTWSIPWEWEAAGTYRLFADFMPTATREGMTLSTTVHVAGDYDPEPAEPAATTAVAGFDVSVEGDLVAGEASKLTMTVTEDGEPVTTLEPYLGAFGHLVVLRDGDLAYLHVHPHGDEPDAGETSGPEIDFGITPPTSGRYLLYLDFQIDGEVHSAPLVVDATAGSEDEAGGDDDD